MAIFLFISNESLKLFSTMLHFVATHSSGTVELIVLISALGIKHVYLPLFGFGSVTGLLVFVISGF